MIVTMILLGLAIAGLFAAVLLWGVYSRARRQVMSLQQELAQTHTNLSRLRHDVRSILSPALLAIDKLSLHPDPAIAQTAETAMSAIDRAAQRLKES